jgi:hypothetical protein
MDYFSSNLRMDGSTKIISSARQKAQARVIGNTLLSVGAGTIYGKPLAADPYMGIGTHVNPYYTMYCLDAAYDIKARIRLVVREWDRVFPTTSSDIEYVSDLHLGINARQDVPGQVEITDDMDGIVNFNDIGSWDEFAPMSRFPGIYDPLVTYWTPYLDPTYVDGWFNPLIFPNYKKGN